MRNITAAIKDKTYEIDDLTLRLDVLKISHPAGRRAVQATSNLSTSTRGLRSASPLAESVGAPSSPLRMKSSARALASETPVVNPQVATIAARALNDERKAFQVKTQLLATRKEPLFNRSVAEKENNKSRASASAVPISEVISRGPVKFKALPSPKRAAAPPASVPAAGTKPAAEQSTVLGGSSSHIVHPQPTRSFGPFDLPSSSPVPSLAFNKPAAGGFGGIPAAKPAAAIAAPPPTSMFSALPQTPTAPRPTVNFSTLPASFTGGSSFSSALAPDTFQPLAPGHDFETGPNRRRGKGSPAHSSAPKLKASFDGQSPLASPAASSAFSFGPPPALLTRGGLSFEGCVHHLSNTLMR